MKKGPIISQLLLSSLNTTLTEQRLLLRTLTTPKILNTIARVKFDIDLVPQARGAAVEPAGLDDDLARHDVQLGVQAGAAVGAEEVVVDFARGAGDVALLGGSYVFSLCEFPCL